MAEFSFNPTRSGPGFLGCPLVGIPFTSNTVIVTENPPDLPLTFTLTGGVLPAGLSIVQTGPDTFVLQGTPTSSGDFVFEITATDNSAMQGTGSFAISIPDFEECTLVDQIKVGASQVGNFIGPISLDIATSPLNSGTPFNVPNILTFIGDIPGLQAAINAGLGTNSNNQVIIDPFASFINANAFNFVFDLFFRRQDCLASELIEDNVLIQSVNDGIFIAVANVLDFQADGCCDCREEPIPPKKRKKGVPLAALPCICIEPEYFTNNECPNTIRYPNNPRGIKYYKIGFNNNGWCCYSPYPTFMLSGTLSQYACMEINRFGKEERKIY